MYIFGCLDTTTVVMDYLTRQEIKPLLCLNKDFNNIRNNGYHSIRVVQDFIKKNKKLKCHENRYNCRKISLKELYQHSSKYIGKTIQFILRSNQKSYQKCFHNILWHCKLGGITLPYNYNYKNYGDNGILAIHEGHINNNIYSTCDCFNNTSTLKLDSPNSFTFFNNSNIYSHSVRIIG